MSGSYAVIEVFQKDFFLVRFDVSGSYAVTEVFQRLLLLGSDEEIRGKTPQSGYEMKRTTSQLFRS